MLAEFLAKEIDKPAPVLVLLGRHLLEDLGGGGIALAQALGVLRENAAVLLLERNGKSKYLALVELRKRFHHGLRVLGPV